MITYIIIDMTEVSLVDFSQVLQTSEETLRLSVDEYQTVLKWKGDEPFDFLGRHSMGLGHDGHTRPVQIGKHVDRKQVNLPRTQSEHEERRRHDQQTMLQRKTDDGVKHGMDAL